MKTNSGFLEKHDSFIERLVEIIAAQPENVANGRKGCTIFFLDQVTGIPEIVQYGDDTPERRLKTARFATEKVFRIVENGDARSALTENPDQNQWGGGIKGSRFAIGTSGWPWQQDEVFSVLLGAIADMELYCTCHGYHDFFFRVIHENVNSFYEDHILGSSSPNDQFNSILPKLAEMYCKNFTWKRFFL